MSELERMSAELSAMADEFKLPFLQQAANALDEVREERDVLRKSHTYCVELYKDALNDFGEPPFVDGRDLAKALGLTLPKPHLVLETR